MRSCLPFVAQVSQMMPPIREQARLSPVALYHPMVTRDGVVAGGVQPDMVFDFDQNFAGWVELVVEGTPTDKV